MRKPKILIVSATKMEAEELLNLQINKLSEQLFQLKYKTLKLDLLITGVGITAMTYHLGKQLQNNTYDFIISIGISGAYSTQIELGEVVNIETERFADLGILNGDNFTDLFDMKLNKKDVFPFENKILRNYTLLNNYSILALKSYQGNTVQTIRPNIIKSIQNNTDVESMEGAAFFYVCLQERIPFVQIRGISNYVGEQDKQLWEISLAVKNLNNVILDTLKVWA